MIKSFGNDIKDLQSEGKPVQRVYSHGVKVWERGGGVVETDLTLVCRMSSSRWMGFGLFPVIGGGYTVDWGDGAVDNKSSHSYARSGLYTVHIVGRLYQFSSQYGSGSTGSWPVVVEIKEGSHFGSDITYLFRAFMNCEMTYLPPDLFKYCTKLYMVQWLFLSCYLLKTVPPNSFENCHKLNELAMMFGECYAITGDVPRLWETAPNAEYPGGCFYDCINAANYDEIPENWR